MSRVNLAHDAREWLRTATGRELVVMLEAVAGEVGARQWPCAGACHLAAQELGRFVFLHPGKELEHR